MKHGTVQTASGCMVARFAHFECFAVRWATHFSHGFGRHMGNTVHGPVHVPITTVLVNGYGHPSCPQPMSVYVRHGE